MYSVVDKTALLRVFGNEKNTRCFFDRGTLACPRRSVYRCIDASCGEFGGHVVRTEGAVSFAAVVDPRYYVDGSDRNASLVRWFISPT